MIYSAERGEYWMDIWLEKCWLLGWYVNKICVFRDCSYKTAYTCNCLTLLVKTLKQMAKILTTMCTYWNQNHTKSRHLCRSCGRSCSTGAGVSGKGRFGDGEGSRTSRAKIRSRTRWYSSSRSSMDLLRLPSCRGTRIWGRRGGGGGTEGQGDRRSGTLESTFHL